MGRTIILNEAPVMTTDCLPPSFQLAEPDGRTTTDFNRSDIEKNISAKSCITASGSGLDPHISPAAAFVQVSRVARTRGFPKEKLMELVSAHEEKHVFGPDVIHVLKLNIALDELK